MGLLDRDYDHKKEHKILEMNEDRTKVFCPHCNKTLEERDEFPDYSMFMGAVWIKQNLPCKPYAKSTKPIGDNT